MQLPLSKKANNRIHPQKITLVLSKCLWTSVFGHIWNQATTPRKDDLSRLPAGPWSSLFVVRKQTNQCCGCSTKSIHLLIMDCWRGQLVVCICDGPLVHSQLRLCISTHGFLSFNPLAGIWWAELPIKVQVTISPSYYKVQASFNGNSLSSLLPQCIL